MWKDDPRFTGMFVRTEIGQLVGSGSLWEIANKYYPLFGAKSVKAPSYMYSFPSGSRMRFKQVANTSDAEKHRGLQYSYIGVDELTQQDPKSIQFLLTCLRSEAKMNSVLVSTCNPSRDSWVYDIVSWYLDERGYVDKEKNGIIRYYTVKDGSFVFADSEEWFRENMPEAVTNMITGEYIPPKKFAFVQLTIFDNKILLDLNPRYLSELQNLPEHERESQLYGCWNAVEHKPTFFNREMVRGKHGERVVSNVPLGATRVRAFDKAATEFNPKANNTDADFTACIGMAKDKLGNYYLYGDFCDENYDQYEKCYGKFRKNSAQRDAIMLAQAQYDGSDTYIVIAKDAGADGKTVYEELSRKFISKGFKIKPSKSGHTQNKMTKFEPFLCAAQAGLVCIVENSFRDARTLELFYKELEYFNPDPVTGKWRSGRNGKKDDWIDVVSDCFNWICSEKVYTVPRLAQVSQESPTLKAKLNL